jgi:multiple sugar transport system substrate-binding protein
MIELRGIAWNHTRGFTPVAATAQRYEELYPGVRISWEKRSLQAFADAPLSELAARYDLIVMDHPHTALAATANLLLPLDEWLPDGFLADQAAHSVGASHDSYRFGGRQWTLATDAAAPVATWRPDLVARHGLALPRTWDEVLDLAREGFVTVSAFPIDVLMHTYTFTQAAGHDPFTTNAGIGPVEAVAGALEELKRLVDLCDPACLERDPIRTAEWMSRAEDDPRAAYCPFAYGYSNYSRPGYARHVLRAGEPVSFGGRPLRTTLGGAGLAVSARTAHPREAAGYAMFTALPEVQRGLYFEAGGQPGHRSAWTDDRVNTASTDFFRATLGALDRALCRPRAPHYMDFQDAGTPLAHAAVAGRRSSREAAAELVALWRTTAGAAPPCNVAS